MALFVPTHDDEVFAQRPELPALPPIDSAKQRRHAAVETEVLLRQEEAALRLRAAARAFVKLGDRRDE